MYFRNCILVLIMMAFFKKVETAYFRQTFFNNLTFYILHRHKYHFRTNFKNILK